MTHPSDELDPAAGLPAPSAARPTGSLEMHWVKNNVLAAILASVVSIVLYGLRQVTGAAGGDAGFGGTFTLYVAALGLWGLWGAASGVLTGAVLQRVVPRLPVWLWIALQVAGAVLIGLGVEMMRPGLPREMSAVEGPSTLATIVFGFVAGSIFGSVGGGLEALVLRRAARGTSAWIICSALAFAVSWSIMTAVASMWDFGTDLGGEVGSHALGFLVSVLTSLIMLPALKRLRSPTLSTAAQHFS